MHERRGAGGGRPEAVAVGRVTVGGLQANTQTSKTNPKVPVSAAPYAEHLKALPSILKDSGIMNSSQRMQKIRQAEEELKMKQAYDYWLTK